jgi:hypothetical protein
MANTNFNRSGSSNDITESIQPVASTVTVAVAPVSVSRVQSLQLPPTIINPSAAPVPDVIETKPIQSTTSNQPTTSAASITAESKVAQPIVSSAVKQSSVSVSDTKPNLDSFSDSQSTSQPSTIKQYVIPESKPLSTSVAPPSAKAIEKVPSPPSEISESVDEKNDVEDFDENSFDVSTY